MVRPVNPGSIGPWAPGLCLLAALFWASPAFAASPKDVEDDIQKAKAFIYSCQNKDGTWESVAAPQRMGGIEARAKTDGAQFGGLTALATYTLITAGDSANDPRLARAIAFLKSARVVGTYALSMRAQVWSVLPPDNVVRMKARGDALALVGGMIASRGGRGFYNYVVNYDAYPVPDWWWDLSNGQIAVLGVWACDHACDPQGAQVSSNYWGIVDEAWRHTQYDSGAWPYSTAHPGDFCVKPRMSMTAAGVATLFITDEYMHRNEGLGCKGYFTDDPIETGIGYIAEHFKDLTGSAKPDCYAFYGLERIGVASGRRIFQNVARADAAGRPTTQPVKVDWYREGADYLAGKQSADGSWGTDDKGEQWSFNPLKLPDTCFATIFLSRGRAPVAISKLRYDAAVGGARVGTAAWDQRPRDVANVARYIASKVERGLNWQTATLRDPLDDLHDAPILYVCGNGDLSPTAEEEAELRRFVEEGGLVVGNADCSSKAFAASFEALGGRLFPAYAFRDLPKNHIIYVGEQSRPQTGRAPTLVRGMSNGVRELMLLAPAADPAKSWQRQAELEHPEHFELMENVLLYATDRLRGLRTKGQSAFPRPDPAIHAGISVKVARLKFDGNWDPEPAGWQRLAAVLHNEKGVDLDVHAVDPEAGPIDPSFKLASLTGTLQSGTTPITGTGTVVPSAAAIGTSQKNATSPNIGTGTAILSAAARDAVRAYVSAGGTLVADAAGGDAGFAASLEKELAAIFPGEPLEPLAEGDAVAAPHGQAVPIAYRDFARKVVGASKSARLRGITRGGRLAVIYSAEDLSAGIVGNEVDGIRGYDPATATALMENVVLLAASGSPPPASLPADAARPPQSRPLAQTRPLAETRTLTQTRPPIETRPSTAP